VPLLNRLLRAGETKLVKRLAKYAKEIDALEPEMQALTDAELRAKTDEFRERYQDGPIPSSSWAAPRCTWGTSPR
jgi:preprotein translocase subunit SecA